MAKRRFIGTEQLTDRWREKIKASQLVDRLCKHVAGEIEMTSTQVRAADIILKKIVPDLARTEHTGKDGGAIQHETKHSDEDIINIYHENTVQLPTTH